MHPGARELDKGVWDTKVCRYVRVMPFEIAEANRHRQRPTTNCLLLAMTARRYTARRRCHVIRAGFLVSRRGTNLAVRQCREERVMTSEDNAAGVRISNWTLATGTKPAERCVYPPPPPLQVRNAEQVARS